MNKCTEETKQDDSLSDVKKPIDQLYEVTPEEEEAFLELEQKQKIKERS